MSDLKILDSKSGPPIVTLTARNGEPIRALIDTGSSTSFGNGKPFSILDDVYLDWPRTAFNLGNLDTDEIGRLAGTHLDYLLGTDVLSRYA